MGSSLLTDSQTGTSVASPAANTVPTHTQGMLVDREWVGDATVQSASAWAAELVPWAVVRRGMRTILEIFRWVVAAAEYVKTT